MNKAYLFTCMPRTNEVNVLKILSENVLSERKRVINWHMAYQQKYTFCEINIVVKLCKTVVNNQTKFGIIFIGISIGLLIPAEITSNIKILHDSSP